MVNSVVGRLWNGALNYVAPQCCIYCDQPSETDIALCEVCRDALMPNDQPCPRCALPDTRGALCSSCLQSPPLLRSITAAYEYDPAIAYFMHRWKYQGDRHLSRTAGKIMLNALKFDKRVDFVLATPLYWRKKLSRGFNQSEDLLTELHRLMPDTHWKRDRNLRLVRTRAGNSQARATRRERLGNLEQAFAVRGDAQGRSIGLVDDVCTTGATGNAMAAALLDAGALEVHLYCLARTPAR